MTFNLIHDYLLFFAGIVVGMLITWRKYLEWKIHEKVTRISSQIWRQRNKDLQDCIHYHIPNDEDSFFENNENN